jgi:hypothetical protein
MEIVKLKQELEKAREDKTELEAEVKSRNEEFYELNQRLIMLEINSSMNGSSNDRQQLNEIQ